MGPTLVPRSGNPVNLKYATVSSRELNVIRGRGVGSTMRTATIITAELLR